MNNDNYSREVANNILQWLGGAKSIHMMIGAKNFMYDAQSADKYLRFDFMRNPSKANRVKITLDEATDTYIVEFIKRGPKMTINNLDKPREYFADKLIKRYEYMYGEDLRDTFMRFTKLTLIIPRVFGINAPIQ